MNTCGMKDLVLNWNGRHLQVIVLDVVNEVTLLWNATSLFFNVPNEGNGKEGVERNIGVPVIMVVMDEGTSSRVGDKEASLQRLGPKN